ncbi:MAG TPA: aminopeptidase P family protein [Ignavibacteria bacterium]|nr:aminopeptidase P family protein [Ignavibacteria bacterium]
MSKQLVKEKIQQAVDILNEKDIELWMTFVRESGNIKDPALDIISETGCTWQSALMINKDSETTAIVGSSEVENFETSKIYRNVIGYLKSIRESLLEYLKKKNPRRIAINYSKNSNLADGLTHGMYLILLEHLKDTDFVNRLTSSEEIISALRGRKSNTELKIMKEAISKTLEIFDEVSSFIKPGKSELEIAGFLKKLTKERCYGFAWEEDHCPAVFTGPEAKSAHAAPTNRKVEKGHLVNIDFGIRYKGYCSDLQRTWYVLKDDEIKAPEPVQNGFVVIRDAILKVVDNLKPGIQGCRMDDIAREYIINHGYEEFPHGLGHQVGKEAHDGGAGLLPRWEKYGNTPFMKIEESQIFTIEPRLYIEGAGTSTLEEEVLITKDGCEFLSKPQTELMLIKS